MNSFGKGIFSFLALLAAINGYTYYRHAGLADYRWQFFWLWSLLVINSIFFIFLLYVLVRLHKRKAVHSAIIVTLFTGLIIGDGFFVRGYSYERKILQETKERGEYIVLKIRDFRKQNHRYPKSLTEIEVSGVPIPTPLIRNSAFSYQLTETGDYYFSFASLDSEVCIWQRNNIWKCQK